MIWYKKHWLVGIKIISIIYELIDYLKYHVWQLLETAERYYVTKKKVIADIILDIYTRGLIKLETSMPSLGPKFLGRQTNEQDVVNEVNDLVNAYENSDWN